MILNENLNIRPAQSSKADFTRLVLRANRGWSLEPTTYRPSCIRRDNAGEHLLTTKTKFLAIAIVNITGNNTRNATI